MEGRSGPQKLKAAKQGGRFFGAQPKCVVRSDVHGTAPHKN